MYKMLMIDVDDTLLNDDMIVTEPTKIALKNAMKKGVFVTLATGRMFAAAKPFAEQLQLNVPLITYQGSLIKNVLDGSILYERHVPFDMARQIFKFAKDHHFHIQAYIDDNLYCLEGNEKIKSYSQFSGVPYIIEPNYETLLTKPLTKLLIYEDPETIDRIYSQCQNTFGEKVHITKSKPFFLEFSHMEGTKGHAIQFLAEYYGCDLKEVIAIGDSWNDKEMIQMAGLGVAMGNAVESLKEIADFISLTNNEDGVKYVIDQFVLADV